jgi:hypothetical protein
VDLINAIFDDVMLDAAMMPTPSSSDGARTGPSVSAH